MEPAFISELLDWCSQWDAQTLSGVSVAVALAVIWIFFKLIRKMVAIAFFLCLVYMGLHYCGIDLFSLFGK
ncbi:MAG: hypothetical protein IJB31_05200 [Akkermansia sp.]|nr:hypothetical protein [Akkermansia sp.]